MHNYLLRYILSLQPCSSGAQVMLHCLQARFTVSPSRCLRLWKRNRSAITSSFGFRWFLDVSVSSSNVFVDGRFGLTRHFSSLYFLPPTNVRKVATRFRSAVCRVSSLSAAPAGNAPIRSIVPAILYIHRDLLRHIRSCGLL